MVMLFARGTIPAKAATKEVEMVLYTHQTVTISLPQKVSRNQVRWINDNKKVLRITSSGKMTGKKAGTATVKLINKKSDKVLSVYKVTVKKFKKQKIAKRAVVTTDSTMNVSKLLNKKYCVIETKGQLNRLKKDICTQYVKQGYGTKKQCMQTEFYKKLSKYDKGFFAKRSLCIMSHTLPSIGQPVSVGDFTKKQTAKGRVYGELEILYQSIPQGTALVTMQGEQNYILELKKSDTQTLENYKISVIKQETSD